jgi:AraC-like DNA-binding protein
VNSRLGEDQYWLATAIGDLLALLPKAEQSDLRDIVSANFTRFIKDAARGSLHIFGQLAGTRFQSLQNRMAGQRLMRPDLLFRICTRLRLPPSEVFRRDPTWEIPKEIVNAGIAAGRRGVWRGDPEKMRSALLEALKENPPPSLNEVARRFKYRTSGPLQRLDAEKCKQIQLRYRAHRQACQSSWTFHEKEHTQQEIENILKDSLARDRPIPVARIAAELGYESQSRLRECFSELCYAITRKETQSRDKRREQMRAALVDALSEQPPPSIASLAERLGTCSSGLAYYFPDLCRQLRDERKAWRPRELDRCRKRIETLLVEMSGTCVSKVCRAAGVEPQIIKKVFPAWYKQIVAKHSEHVARRRQKRREVLRHDVRKAVNDLLSRGLPVNLSRVLPLLSTDAARDWKLICEGIDQALLERASREA